MNRKITKEERREQRERVRAYMGAAYRLRSYITIAAQEKGKNVPDILNLLEIYAAAVRKLKASEYRIDNAVYFYGAKKNKERSAAKAVAARKEAISD